VSISVKQNIPIRRGQFSRCPKRLGNQLVMLAHSSTMTSLSHNDFIVSQWLHHHFPLDKKERIISVATGCRNVVKYNLIKDITVFWAMFYKIQRVIGSGIF